MWTTDKESFIFMQFVKARRLRDLIHELDNAQKILILKNIGHIILKYLMSISFCNLSIDNIYLDERFQVKLLDCIFIVDNTDNRNLPPEVKHLSNLQDFEIGKVDIYS